MQTNPKKWHFSNTIISPFLSVSLNIYLILAYHTLNSININLNKTEQFYVLFCYLRIPL